MLPTVDAAQDCCHQLSLQADMRSRRVRRQALVVTIVVLACFTYLTAAMEGSLSSMRKLKQVEEAPAPDQRPIVIKTPSGKHCPSYAMQHLLGLKALLSEVLKFRCGIKQSSLMCLVSVFSSNA